MRDLGVLLLVLSVEKIHYIEYNQYTLKVKEEIIM